jgi:hypothetical protein
VDLAPLYLRLAEVVAVPLGGRDGGVAFSGPRAAHPRAAALPLHGSTGTKEEKKPQACHMFLGHLPLTAHRWRPMRIFGRLCAMYGVCAAVSQTGVPNKNNKNIKYKKKKKKRRRSSLQINAQLGWTGTGHLDDAGTTWKAWKEAGISRDPS